MISILCKKIQIFNVSPPKSKKLCGVIICSLGLMLCHPKLFAKIQKILCQKRTFLFKTQCSKSPKLRTYNSLFSVFDDQKLSNSYTRLCLPFIVRKRLSQLRLGVLPLRIESDRFSRVKVDAKNRFCRQPLCKKFTVTTHSDQLEVENEFHFLITGA